jgi:aminoglycoside 3-N-acetyltransferase
MHTETDWIETMAQDLLALGVRPGGVLLVHSSLRSLGAVPGAANRAETAVRGLLRALGQRGTLLMPALSYASTGAHNPVFDVRATPSCVGALTEYFRCRAGVTRSVHPTHSVSAFGPLADDLLGAHQRDTTPCGPHSPFSKLRAAGGQILFLGCGMRTNTSMHAIEEHILPPYLFAQPVDYRIVLADGSETQMRVRSHDFKGWAQRYERVAGLLSAPDLRCGKVLAADCHLLEAGPMWSAALAAYRHDPLYFVERSQP